MARRTLRALGLVTIITSGALASLSFRPVREDFPKPLLAFAHRLNEREVEEQIDSYRMVVRSPNPSSSFDAFDLTRAMFGGPAFRPQLEILRLTTSSSVNAIWRPDLLNRNKPLLGRRIGNMFEVRDVQTGDDGRIDRIMLVHDESDFTTTLQVQVEPIDDATKVCRLSCSAFSKTGPDGPFPAPIYLLHLLYARLLLQDAVRTVDRETR